MRAVVGVMELMRLSRLGVEGDEELKSGMMSI